jgi:tellurite resistance protein TerC
MGIESVGTPVLWGSFLCFVALMLALDLGVFNRKPHASTLKEAATWSVVWIALSLAFTAFVALRWGSELGQAFLTGYLIEKALSVDNLFVFYTIFAAFSVPVAYQHRLLFWGIIGALVLRAIMVFGGSALLVRFHWVVYVFGASLVVTGVRMLARPEKRPRPERSRLFRLIRRLLPSTPKPHKDHLFVWESGKLLATPLFLVLLLVELTDVVFAVDSILAIFAITADPFIVYTSNIFAVMGMRSLYLLLAGVAKRFEYLQPGLAMVLIFVGVKMAASELVEIPTAVSLAVVLLLLGGSVLASLVSERRTKVSARRHAPSRRRVRSGGR